MNVGILKPPGCSSFQHWVTWFYLERLATRRDSAFWATHNSGNSVTWPTLVRSGSWEIRMELLESWCPQSSTQLVNQNFVYQFIEHVNYSWIHYSYNLQIDRQNFHVNSLCTWICTSMKWLDDFLGIGIYLYEFTFGVLNSKMNS